MKYSLRRVPSFDSQAVPGSYQAEGRFITRSPTSTKKLVDVSASTHHIRRTESEKETDSSSFRVFECHERDHSTRRASAAGLQSSSIHSMSIHRPTPSRVAYGIFVPDHDDTLHSTCHYQRSTHLSSHHKRPTQKRPRTSTTFIEIAPGLHSPLRGSEETWAAILNDFYLPALCLCCNETVFCIQDAGFVLCPTCRVVSPLEGMIDNVAAGVGLGFTFSDLQRWQHELER